MTAHCRVPMGSDSGGRSTGRPAASGVTELTANLARKVLSDADSPGEVVVTPEGNVHIFNKARTKC